MAFSSALAMRVLSRSESSMVTGAAVPPSGGVQRARRAVARYVKSMRLANLKAFFPVLMRSTQRSVVLCQSSETGRVRI